MALIHGRDFVVPDDIKEVAIDALSHRVILHTEVILDGIKEETVVKSVLDTIPVPVSLGDGQYDTVPDSNEISEAAGESSSDDSTESEDVENQT